jgi:hypothetical protein
MDAKKTSKSRLAGQAPVSRNGHGEAQTLWPTYGGADSILEWPVIDVVWPVVESNPAAPLLASALACLYPDGTIGSFLQARRDGGNGGEVTAAGKKGVVSTPRLPRKAGKSPLVEELRALQREQQRLRNRLGMRLPETAVAGLRERVSELEGQIKSLRLQLKERKQAQVRVADAVAVDDGKKIRRDKRRHEWRPRFVKREAKPRVEKATAKNSPARMTPALATALMQSPVGRLAVQHVAEKVVADARERFSHKAVRPKPPLVQKPGRRELDNGLWFARLECPEAEGFVSENEAPPMGMGKKPAAPAPKVESVTVVAAPEALKPRRESAPRCKICRVKPASTEEGYCRRCLVAVSQVGKKIPIDTVCDQCGGRATHFAAWLRSRRDPGKDEKDGPVHCYRCRPPMAAKKASAAKEPTSAPTASPEFLVSLPTPAVAGGGQEAGLAAGT